MNPLDEQEQSVAIPNRISKSKLAPKFLQIHHEEVTLKRVEKCKF